MKKKMENKNSHWKISRIFFLFFSLENVNFARPHSVSPSSATFGFYKSPNPKLLLLITFLISINHTVINFIFLFLNLLLSIPLSVWRHTSVSEAPQPIQQRHESLTDTCPSISPPAVGYFRTFTCVPSEFCWLRPSGVHTKFLFYLFIFSNNAVGPILFCRLISFNYKFNLLKFFNLYLFGHPTLNFLNYWIFNPYNPKLSLLLYLILKIVLKL